MITLNQIYSDCIVPIHIVLQKLIDLQAHFIAAEIVSTSGSSSGIKAASKFLIENLKIQEVKKMQSEPAIETDLAVESRSDERQKLCILL